MKFEEALERLKEIVEDLERGDGTLDEALSRFEEALTLGKACQELLEKTQLRIRKLTGEEEDGPVEEREASSEPEAKASRKAAAGRQGSLLEDAPSPGEEGGGSEGT